MDREIAYVALNLLPGIGPVKVRQLLERFGTAPAILEAKSAQLSEVLRQDLANTVRNWRDEIDLDAEIGKIEAKGLNIIDWEHDLYPAQLREIHAPPVVLYVWGNLTPADQHALAVVGTRRMTHYGRESTKKITFQLAHAGYTIVSGLAAGIDTIAHESALAANGRTIAVLGSGFARLYPPENQKLAQKIAENGAVISQFPFDITTDPRLFPIRNQTVSGMSYGVIVIEGNIKSGSMITAKAAVEHNRVVFALPGPIDRQTSGGPNSLIQDGAKLITCPADVVQDLPLVMPVNATEPEPTDLNEENLSPEDLKVYQALSDAPATIDHLAAATGLASPRLSATLLRLEMQGFARQLPGMAFVKVEK